ncbi:MAG: hypothetical protein KC506_00130 [Nanoarchaeota archaeon]|nr:hypothetical protein [Nanoarchaeota archaeon]
MKDSDENKLFVLGIAIMVTFTIFAGSVGYIAVFSPLFGAGVQLSPDSVYDNECINHVKVNCGFDNEILDDLLCSC